MTACLRKQQRPRAYTCLSSCRVSRLLLFVRTISTARGMRLRGLGIYLQELPDGRLVLALARRHLSGGSEPVQTVRCNFHEPALVIRIQKQGTVAGHPAKDS